MAEAPATDDDLMAEARRDVAAFAELVRRHQRFALRVAFAHLGDADSAEDAAQAAFIAIYDGRERYQASGRFRGFLFRVVTNQCLMLQRSERARERSRERVRADGARAADAVSETALLAREMRSRVFSAVASLPEEKRDTVLLSYVAGLSHKEIADALGTEVGTVKSRLFDALKRLKRVLGKEDA